MVMQIVVASDVLALLKIFKMSIAKAGCVQHTHCNSLFYLFCHP